MANKTLFSAFRQISGLTAVSRMLGFIRDVVFAHYLGAGAATDAFLVAFKLPNLFRRLTAERSVNQCFFAKLQSRKTAEIRTYRHHSGSRGSNSLIYGLMYYCSGYGTVHALYYQWSCPWF